MDELMLFPLNTVLMPGATLPLHIFEPRYRTMVRICLREQRSFGIVLIRGGAEVGGPATPHRVGVEATILAWQELDEGRFNIVVQGGKRFEILDLDHSRPYLVAHVGPFVDVEGDEHFGPEDRAALLESAAGWWPSIVAPGKSTDFESLSDLADAELTFVIADLLPVPPAAKQVVLEATSAAERAKELVRLTAGLEATAPRPSVP